MADYVKRATVAVATNQSIAMGVDLDGSPAQQSVDRRVVPAVAQALADDVSLGPVIEVLVDGAVAAAVDDEVESRGLIDTLDPRLLRDMPLEELLLFTALDSEGFRLWLETALDGGPSPYAAGLIAAVLARENHALAMAPALVNDILLTAIDANGFRLWLETGLDGAPSEYAARLIAAALTRGGYLGGGGGPGGPVTIAPAASPATLDLVMGAGGYPLYHQRLADDGTLVETRFPVGTNSDSAWRYTPTAPGSWVGTIRTHQGGAFTDKPCTLVVRAKPTITPRFLAVGDSRTRPNLIGSQAAALANGIAIGTRRMNSAGGEGRGGWRLADYMTRIGRADGLDSPFIFPAGVAGAKYRGNVRFWQRVMHTDPTGYDYEGFQAAGGTEFGTDGYPVTPAVDDVVADPTHTAFFRRWTGTAWVAHTVTPAYEVSFSKYIARWSAFLGGAPTVISIDLGTNDFYSAWDTTLEAAWQVQLNAFLSSIREWNATIPVILTLPFLGGPAANWTAASKRLFEQRMRDHARAVIAAYSTTPHTTICSLTGALTGETGFSDHLHLDTATNAQPAIWLAGAITKAVS